MLFRDLRKCSFFSCFCSFVCWFFFFSILRSLWFLIVNTIDANPKLAFLRFPLNPLFQLPIIFPLSTALPRNQQRRLPSTSTKSITVPSTAAQVVTTTKPSCPSEQFQCRNGKCLDTKYRCDGYDYCGDMSDEQNCPCRNNQMTCANGACVDKIWICDGSDDCGDGSDEKNCSVSTAAPCKAIISTFKLEKWNSVFASVLCLLNLHWYMHPKQKCTKQTLDRQSVQ